MRETAVFAYIVAVFVAVATVVFAFVSIYTDHPTNSVGAFIIGGGTVALLWSMAHWIEDKNS